MPEQTAPVANDDYLQSDMNEVVRINPYRLLGNDTDINGDEIEGVSIQDAVNGTVTVDGVNVIFIPHNGYTGPASFTYTITDNAGGFDTAKVNLNIAAVNAMDDTVITSIDGTTEIRSNVLLQNDFLNDHPSTITSVQDALNGTVSLSDNGLINFTPTKVFTGEATFTYTVENKSGLTDTASVNIDVQSQPRIIFDTLESGINEQHVIFSEYDTHYAHKSTYYNATNSTVSVESGSTGWFGGTYYRNVLQLNDRFTGEASFDYTTLSSDGVIYAGSRTYNVVKNFDPFANHDTLDGFSNTQTLTPISTLLANDIDPENQTMSLVSVQDATNGSVVIEKGFVIFTPSQDYTGEASYTYTVEDNRGNVDTATVNLTIKADHNTSLNDSNESNQLDEGGILQVLNGEAGDLLNNATGENPTIIGFRLGGDEQLFAADTVHIRYIPSISSHVTFIINANGSYQIESESDFYGELPDVHYIVSDDSGATMTSTLSLTVNPVNDAPSANSANDIANVSNNYGQSVISTALLLEKYTSDADGDQLTVTSVQDATNGTVNIVDGEIIFTPTAGYTGPATFTYTVSDGNGESDTASASLKVVKAPEIQANNDTVTSTQADVITIPESLLLVNDENSSRFGVRIESVQSAVNGTVSFDGELVTFTPNAGYTGPASFEYTLVNHDVRETATVNLTIGEAPDTAVLVANDDQFDMTYEQPFNLNHSNSLKDNDLDTNASAGRAKLFNAEGGSIEEYSYYDGLSFSTGFTFTASGSADTRSVEYAINDTQGNISIAKVSFNFPDDPTPIGRSETIFTLSDSFEINHRHFLNNDIDPQAQALSVVSVQNNINGTADLLNNSVAFNADPAAASDIAFFQYSISNGSEYHFAQANVNVETDFKNIRGSEEDDIFLGGAENEVIYAKAGNDILIGGAGNDTLYGGKGADTFVWNANDLGAVQLEVDNIRDFDLGKDKLDFKDFFNDANADNLSQLLVIDRVNQHTEIQVRTDVDQADPELLVILHNRDLSNGDTLSSEQMVANLLTNNNLIID